MVARSTIKNLGLEPRPLDVIFDKNGQTAGNHEGNLRFHRLLFLYHVEKYQFASTNTHKSLIRIEFLDELKSLDVRCFTCCRTSLRPNEDDEQPPFLFSDIRLQEEESNQMYYSHLDDDRTLRRIREAFKVLSRRSKMAKKPVSGNDQRLRR